ncbi:MAG TPA: hypothetical protein VGL56_18720 [Fimbriimonadaceae bacterium]|jgi:hypothetical protein
MKRMLNKSGLGLALAGIVIALTLVGCHDNVSDVQKPVNKADPTGMGLTNDKRASLINSADMTPAQKQAALQNLGQRRHIMGRATN